MKVDISAVVVEAELNVMLTRHIKHQAEQVVVVEVLTHKKLQTVTRLLQQTLTQLTEQAAAEVVQVKMPTGHKEVIVQEMVVTE